MITVSEATRRFGDLCQIRRGQFHWISVDTANGTWVPVFDETGILLLGYRLEGKPTLRVV